MAKRNRLGRMLVGLFLCMIALGVLGVDRNDRENQRYHPNGSEPVYVNFRAQ